MKLNILTTIITGAALLAEIAGCSSDNVPGAPVPAEARFSISTRVETASDGSPLPATSDNEKISDWWLAFARTAGADSYKVVKVVRRSEALPEAAATAVERESFSCTLPAGTYTVFAFANIAPIADFSEGKTIVNPRAMAWSGTDSINCMEGNIPMTGMIEDVKVENTIQETFALEVVRMAAKLELQFSNPTSGDVTVGSISFSPVTAAKTPEALFPDYTALGSKAFTPLPGADYCWIKHAPELLKVKADGGIATATVYLQESLSDHPNDGAFTLGLEVRHADLTEDIIHYNITDNVRRYINRNDWIRIPVTLSQYAVAVKALFYPPIGGYPALTSQTDPTGAQIFTFATGGDFSIVAQVTDKLTGRELTPTAYTISHEISKDENAIITSLKAEEASAALPPHLTGKLSTTAKGTAIVNVTVKINDVSYTRKIYIIRS